MARGGDIEPLLWVGLVAWLYSKLESPATAAVKALEQKGADLFETMNPDEKGHTHDLPGHQLSRPVLLDLATRAGFPNPNLAVAIALAESGGVPNALTITDRETSIGLWQINIKAHPQYTRAQLADPGQNALAALAISKRGTDWRPWSVWWRDAGKRLGPGEGRYRKYL